MASAILIRISQYAVLLTIVSYGEQKSPVGEKQYKGKAFKRRI